MSTYILEKRRHFRGERGNAKGGALQQGKTFYPWFCTCRITQFAMWATSRMASPQPLSLFPMLLSPLTFCKTYSASKKHYWWRIPGSVCIRWENCTVYCHGSEYHLKYPFLHCCIIRRSYNTASWVSLCTGCKPWNRTWWWKVPFNGADMTVHILYLCAVLNLDRQRHWASR